MITTPEKLVCLFSDWPEQFSTELAEIQTNPVAVKSNAEEYLCRLVPLLGITWEILYVQQRSENNAAIVKFYETLFRVLRRVAARFQCASQHRHFTPFEGSQRVVKLYYHTNVRGPRFWNYKEAYLPDYVSVDKMGYSGWAELAERPELVNQLTQISNSDAEEFYTQLRQRYIASNSSKYIQPTVNGEELPADYFFIPLQLPNDKTQEIARIKTLELAQQCVAKLAPQNAIVFKRHPLCNDAKVEDFLRTACTIPNVFVSKASIHPLLAKSKAVVTVNSGVGFEALLHLKRVFVSGRCDYQAVCDELKDSSSIETIPSRAAQPLNTMKVKKFLFLLLNNYQCRADDEQHVAMHLLRTLFLTS